jgi:hypothetical protein
MTSDLVLKTSGAVTANGNSETQTVDIFGEGILLIDITAVSGTSPTLNVVVESFVGGQWVTIETLTQQTAAGKVVVKLTNFGKQIRLRWTVGGTAPSFTFSSHFLVKITSK